VLQHVLLISTGAFVAGLDAGLVYNSYPLMGDKIVPDDWLAFKPVLRNFTENPTTVQFDHRTLVLKNRIPLNVAEFLLSNIFQAHITVFLLSSVWFMSRRLSLPPRARYAANALAAMAWIQVIYTILYPGFSI